MNTKRITEHIHEHWEGFKLLILRKMSQCVQFQWNGDENMKLMRVE